MLILPILTLASLAGQAYGAAQSAKLRKNQERELARRRAGSEALFNKEYYSNVNDRPENKSVMQMISDRIKNQQALNTSKAAITGATDESQLAAGENQAQAYDQTLKGLAENEGQKRQQAIQTKIGQDNILTAQQGELDQAKAESTSNLINNAVSLGNSAINTDKY